MSIMSNQTVKQSATFTTLLNTSTSFTIQQFPLSRAPRWAPFMMNFTAGGCRQQGQTNHSVDGINHIQNNTIQCSWAPPSFSPNLET